jgi:hypothetical protein
MRGRWTTSLIRAAAAIQAATVAGCAPPPHRDTSPMRGMAVANASDPAVFRGVLNSNVLRGFGTVIVQRQSMDPAIVKSMLEMRCASPLPHDLAASLRARNAVAARLPEFRANVEVRFADRPTGLPRPRAEGRRRRGPATCVLSLPGYTANRRLAVVCVSYWGGPKAAGTQIMIMRREGDSWRVDSYLWGMFSWGRGWRWRQQYALAGRLTAQIELNPSNTPVITTIDSYDPVGKGPAGTRMAHRRPGCTTAVIA